MSPAEVTVDALLAVGFGLIGCGSNRVAFVDWLFRVFLVYGNEDV
jgi:hypothetical protein